MTIGDHTTLDNVGKLSLILFLLNHLDETNIENMDGFISFNQILVETVSS